MKRKPFSFVSMISLLLCIATVALWVRSYWVSDWIRCPWLVLANAPEAKHREPSDRHYSIEVFDGVGCCGFSYGNIYTSHGFSLPHLSYYRTEPFDFHDALGTRFGFIWGPVNTVPTFVTTPFWLPVLIFLILPVRSLVRIKRRHRIAREGRCTVCGYDLAGNVSGVCPECGRRVPSKSEATV